MIYRTFISLLSMFFLIHFASSYVGRKPSLFGRVQRQFKKPFSMLAPPVVNDASSNPSHSVVSSEEFSKLDISPIIQRSIAEVMKYQYMTKVQAASLPIILQGTDCLAKAKTGTGKTLGFLIPSIELMTKHMSTIGLHDIPTIVISPTRELANQIAQEAKTLLSFHPRKQVVCIYGGVRIETDQARLRQTDIAVLVATPGRLEDHLENTPGFSNRLQSTRMVVLDEADRLLDMGFKPSIDRIFSFLPPKSKRQTLLFSATVSKTVEGIAQSTLRPGYAFIDTVGEDTEQTHQSVSQEVLVLPTVMDLIPTVLTILQEQMKNPNYKIIVFCATARTAGFCSDIFKAMNIPNLAIHSRLSQGARMKTSEAFRKQSNVILFSSDVSARGMDYPDVSFVLQLGSTEKEQYIHRLGRTARGGKTEGSGMIVLYPFEAKGMLNALKEFPLKRIPFSTLTITNTTAMTVQRAMQQVCKDEKLSKSASQAYQAWLGYYNCQVTTLGWSKEAMVESATEYAKSCGLLSPPMMDAFMIGKMGLRGIPGLRVNKEPTIRAPRGGGGGGGSRDGGARNNRDNNRR